MLLSCWALYGQAGVLSYTKCDQIHDDTAGIQAALNAHVSVYVPSKTTCYLFSTSLVIPTSGHFYGQDYTSVIKIVGASWAKNYNFAANGRFTNVTVSGNSGSGGTGTVTLSWPHLLAAGSTFTLAGSATSGLNSTFTITALVSPAAFSFASPASVSNGTYTDLTTVSATTGVDSPVIKCAVRDDGNASTSCAFELDHMTIQTIGSGSLVMIDETGMRNSSFHHLAMLGDGPGSGQIAFNLADRSTNGNGTKSVFFNNHYSISVGQFQEIVHLSSHDGNAGASTFRDISGSGRIAVDTYGTLNNSNGLQIERWYSSSDNDPLSYTFVPNPPGNSFYSQMGVEGAFNAPTGYASNVGNFAFVPATAGYIINLPEVTADSVKITGKPSNSTACFTAAGKVGYCSTAVAADGTCTCN